MPGSWGDCLIRAKHGTLSEGGTLACVMLWAGFIAGLPVSARVRDTSIYMRPRGQTWRWYLT